MEVAAAAVAGLAGSVVLAKVSSPAGSSGGRPAESAMDEALRKLDLSRLLRRLAHEDGLGTVERAAGAIQEYKLFLRLVWLHPRENLLPSATVDAVWQRHLLDTKVYHEDCLALFGVHMHRIYGTEQADDALARTRSLYHTVFTTLPSNDLWSGTAIVPAFASVSPILPPPPQSRPQVATLAPIDDEDLEWLGAAVAKELPLKQAVCKKSEPLREIAIRDPAATVAEYKKFIRMMVDEKGAWFTPSKLVDELWHRHMLDTLAYCEFCKRVNGSYLHHTPHYGKPHSYHDPGFMATLKAYEDKFADVPPNTIWGTVGESGGGGGGGGCGGGGGGGGCGGGGHVVGGYGGYGPGVTPADGMCFMILCPCICMCFALPIAYFTIYEFARESCVSDMPDQATACSQMMATPILQDDGVWVLPIEEEDRWTEAEVECNNDKPCGAGMFCNFDSGDSGFCEDCTGCQDCHCGLPDGGATACSSACHTTESSYTGTMLLYTTLGTCADQTLTAGTSGNTTGGPWVSTNQRTGTGKTCAQYAGEMLCKLCDATGLSNADTGGLGWNYEWGSPDDPQYANGGMTAIDACCACGGGDQPLAGASSCKEFEQGCEQIEECTSGKQATIFAVVFVLVVAAGVACFSYAQKRRKERSAEAATAAPATAVAMQAAGASALVVNPLNNVTATPVANGAALMQQVTVPQGVGPGQPMLVNTAGGQMQVTVPAGLMPGSVFQISIPAATPTVAVATATPAVATPTVAAATATPAVATATPAVATATPAVATATPTVATATPAVATATPAVATATPAVATATPAVATATPAVATATTTTTSAA